MSCSRIRRLAGVCAHVVALAVTSSAYAAFPGANGLPASNSDREGDFEIFSMRSNWKDPTQLTHNTATESIPDWQRLPHGQSR